MFCSSCTQVETYPNIIAPASNKVPIEGKWRFYKFINGSSITDAPDSEGWIGKVAQFNSSEVLIGESYWKNPSYKIKSVDADEYLSINKYNITKNKLDIQNEDVFVVSVTSVDKFLYEFVKISDNELMVTIKGITYFLRKISDKTDTKISKTFSEMQKNVSNGIKETSSCILLGIRSQKTKSDGTVEYTYSTLWIGYNENNLEPVLKTENILLPRKSGFWNVEVKKVTQGQNMEDFIVANSIVNNSTATSTETSKSSPSSKKETNDKAAVTDKKDTSDKKDASIKKDTSNSGGTTNDVLTLNNNTWKDKIGQIQKVITYIGNDYVSLEVNSSGKYVSTGADWKDNILEIQPIDNTNLTHGINIEEMSAENGFSILMNDRNNAINQSSIQGTIVDHDADANYGLKRRLGYWCFYGRVNYIEDSISKYIDYKINIAPPKKVVFYDSLSVPWKVIQDKLPDAKDAFTSPNDDIAIILSPQNYLYIYKIENGTLSISPLKKIKLQDQDSICMSEWATGSFVNAWEKEFTKHGYSEVKENLQ